MLSLPILLQLFITIGILVAQLINYGNQHYTWGWRLNLGLAGIPALLLIIGAALVPETPSHIVERGNIERGREVLQKIRGTDGEAGLESMLLCMVCMLQSYLVTSRFVGKLPSVQLQYQCACCVWCSSLDHSL